MTVKHRQTLASNCPYTLDYCWLNPPISPELANHPMCMVASLLASVSRCWGKEKLGNWISTCPIFLFFREIYHQRSLSWLSPFYPFRAQPSMHVYGGPERELSAIEHFTGSYMNFITSFSYEFSTCSVHKIATSS